MRWLVLLVCLLLPRLAAAEPRLLVVSRVGQGVADASPKRARVADGVTLYAVLVDGAHVYSNAVPLKLNGKRVDAKPLPLDLELRWYRVEPEVEDMSNTASGKFKYEAVPYVETEITAARGKPFIAADVRPTKTTDRGGGLGTMRYKITAVYAGKALASPGGETRRGKGSGGLADAVHRVSLRKDDSYLGYLGEMFGQPYIWASAGGTDATHQSERLEGSDCADFVVYGWRRQGHKVAYTWSGGLPGVTTKLAAGARSDSGVYLDDKGQPIAFPQPGDILLFPRHVGVLVSDRGVKGVLDDQDVLFHTLFASPVQQPLAETGYAHRPVEVRRLKQ